MKPDPDPQFNSARALYLAQWGSTTSVNAYLKLLVFLLAIIVIGLVWLNYRTAARADNIRPLVIRIDEIGRAEAVQYSSLEYRPQDREVRYFLSQFAQKYYTRNHVTLKNEFTQSLLFLEGKLANALVDEVKKTKVLDDFLRDNNLPEVEVEVLNVVLEPMTTAPYKGRLDMVKRIVNRYDRQVLKKQISTVSFNFSFSNNVEPKMIQVNPLGMIITSFREDEAFAPDTPTPETTKARYQK